MPIHFIIIDILQQQKSTFTVDELNQIASKVHTLSKEIDPTWLNPHVSLLYNGFFCNLYLTKVLLYSGGNYDVYVLEEALNSRNLKFMWISKLPGKVDRSIA